MGNIYCVRVFAHNSTGYSKSAKDSPTKSMQSPDPPYLPRLFWLENADSYKMITFLVIEWDEPMINKENGRPDMVGDGGSTMKTH